MNRISVCHCTLLFNEFTVFSTGSTQHRGITAVLEAPVQAMQPVVHGTKQVQYRLVPDKLEIRDEIRHENVDNYFSGHIGRADITRVPHIQKTLYQFR